MAPPSSQSDDNLPPERPPDPLGPDWVGDLDPKESEAASQTAPEAGPGHPPLRTARARLEQALEDLTEFTVDIIYGRRRGLAAFFYGGFLRVLSGLFWLISTTRLKLYQNRIMRPHHLGCLVIVVGNLTVGGTGKTPVVEKLARSLQARGRSVAILSRGYKSKKEPFFKQLWRQLTHGKAPPPKVVSDGRHVLLDSSIAGDEPFMLARNLPGVPVVVDKDRAKAGRYAIREFGADTLILDDGYQYFPLKDHMQVLLIDKTNPFGNGALLPRGVLREPVSQLKRASHIFLTKSDGQPNEELLQTIRQYKPKSDIIECRHAPRSIMSLDQMEKRPLDCLQGRRVGAFCGIATPESFAAFLEAQGAEIVHHRWFLDHHQFSDNELENFFEEAEEAGAKWVLTTEKDAVRLPPDYSSRLPLYYLRVEIEIIAGVEDFEQAVSRICYPKSRLRTTRRPFAPGRRGA